MPRWRPPFISALAPHDRCHLNGLGLVDDRPRYATSLGHSDEPGGWRPHKKDGGTLMDVTSNQVILSGLSMPHSPRWAVQQIFAVQVLPGMSFPDLVHDDMSVLADSFVLPEGSLAEVAEAFRPAGK